MATQRQIAANRRNAKKSTGPKTAQGKSVSSRNALKSGECVVILEETIVFTEHHYIFIPQTKRVASQAPKRKVAARANPGLFCVPKAG